MTDEEQCPTNTAEMYQTIGELKGMTKMIHNDLKAIKAQAPAVQAMQADIDNMKPLVADYMRYKQRFIGASLVTGVFSGIFAVVSAFFALFGVHLPNPFDGGG